MSDLPLRRRARGALQRHAPGMITCREFEDFVQRYLDEDLPLHQRAVFEVHMVFCEECRAYLEQYRKAVALGTRLLGEQQDQVPTSVPEDLVTAILDALTLDSEDTE